MTSETTGTTRRPPTDFTEGSIFGSILRMGLPSMVGFLLQHVYALTDMWWVSNLENGEAGVAAITFINQILGLLFAFNSLIGPGSVAIISRRYGEKKFDSAEQAIKETLLLKLFFGLMLGITGYGLVNGMVGYLGAEGITLALATSYGEILFLAMPVLYATYSIFTAMRGVANPNMALILMALSSLLNMILDPILMFGYLGMPALGLEGAAYATTISFYVTFAVGLGLFYGGRTNVRLRLAGREKVGLQSMLKMVRIGIPAFLSDVSFFGARAVITRLVAPFGTSVVAAWGIGSQISALGIMLLVGIGLGLSSLIGHNLGSGKVARARTTGDQAVLLGVGLMTLYGMITFFFATQIVGLFFSELQTVVHGVTILRILSLCFPFVGALLMMEQIHMGVGMNVPAMVVTSIRAWGMQVAPVLIMTQLLGYDHRAVWWSITISAIISTIGFYVYYRRGRWLERKV